VKDRFVAATRRLGGEFASRWPIGLRASLMIGIPLLAGAVAGRTSWGAVASMGSFAGFYGPNTPYRHRIRLVAGIGAALAVLVPLGSLCATRAWLAVIFAGVVAALASFVCLALSVPPPREYLIVLAALAATGIPARGPGALRELALVAGGALIASLVTMAPALGRGRAVPQERALSQAWVAVSDVLRTAGTPEAADARGQAVADVTRAREVLRQGRPRTDDPRLRSLAAAEIVLASALSVSLDARTPVGSSWVDNVQQLGAMEPDGGHPPAGGTDSKAEPGPSGLGWAFSAARRVLDGQTVSLAAATVDYRDMTELDRRGIIDRLRAATRPAALVVPAAGRIGIAVAAGSALGRILGLDHSYWVGLTAAAALQANNVSFLLRRSLNRLGGTMAGVVLAGIVFATHPDAVAVIVVAAGAQFLAETLIRAYYGLAVVFVTVLALSIFDLAVPGTGIGDAIGARILDTAIGVALVVVLRLVLWRRATGARMPQVQADTLQTVAEVFRSRWLSDSGTTLTTAARLREKLLHLRAVNDDMLADQITGGRAALHDQVTLAIDELAMLALGVPFDRPAPSRTAAAALVGRLEQAAVALHTGGDLSPGIRGPVLLPGYPRTRAATELLTSALH
jgi:uncharacterized membrane protein YccC